MTNKYILNKILLKVLLIILVFINIFAFDAKALDLDAEGVVLMDPVTNEIIYSKNPYVQFEPASTTKVMTAILTLENCKLDDIVTIGINPPNTIGSALGVAKDETYTVKELLYALLLLSGNDCANALAEHISGSVDEFAKLMTKKAKELGANDTVFKNPSGLPEDGHITTAYDLCLIMKNALSYPEFIEISRTPDYFYKDHPYPDGNEKWAFNGNHCINKYSKYYYEYALSGKTGYTTEANHTYTGAAKKGNQVLIASFLNAKNKDIQFMNVGELFDYGFDNFETVKLIQKNDKLDEYKINDTMFIPLLADKDIYYTKNKYDSMPNFSIDYAYKDITKQSISKGDVLLNANVIVNDKPIDNINLVSGSDRKYTKIIALKEYIHNIFKYTNIIIITLISILIILVVILFIIKRKRKKLIRNKYRYTKIR